MTTLVAATVVVGCAVGDASPTDDRAEPVGTASATAAPAPTSTSASTSSTSVVPPTTAPCDRRAALDAGAEAVPPALRQRIDAALADPRLAGVDRSVSVWIAGYGVVVDDGADRALLPASNQKLLTAIGSGLLLDPAARFRTEVRASDGQLVLVAGGDPTLRSGGAHSLAELARQVRAAGIDRVSGVLVDATRFEASTTAHGWQDWQVPQYVGPLSALTVDDNRARGDATFLADPALGNAERFRASLVAAGVVVDGGVAHGVAGPGAPVVASLESAPVTELVGTMLQRSDNEIAEALLRQMGGGSTAGGVGAVDEALAPWCLHLSGVSGDGSGLSRADLRPAAEWRRLLQVVAEQPWAADTLGGLPVAGRSGTLAGRLGGPATAGNVRAKTGTIIGGSSLSGYAITADGRPVVFSIVVNGEPGAAARSTAGIDRLVTALVSG